MYDDPKRLDRDFPEAMAKVRERTGAGEDDLLLLAGWAGEPKGHRPEETVYQACGQLRLYAAQKYNDRHKLLDPEELRVPLGGGLPDVRVGRRRQPLERGASSVHVGARRGSGEADDRPGALPRQIVRPGAERRRSWARARFVFTAATCSRRFSRRSDSAKKKRSAASASCWTRWNTALRRTAASRWDLTGW